MIVCPFSGHQINNGKFALILTGSKYMKKIEKTVFSGLVAVMISAIFVACSGSGNNPDSHEGHNHEAMGHGSVSQTDSDAETKVALCPVSGEELGSMGEPVKVIHEGHEVKLCCNDCVKEFETNPSKYLTSLKSEDGEESHSNHSQDGHH